MKVVPLDISDYYAEAKRAWGEHALPPLSQIRVTLQPYMTRAGGRAFPQSFRRRNGQVVDRDWFGITISRPWFKALNDLVPAEVENEFRDVVLHELAHIACYFVYPGHSVGHGWQWREFCKQVGCRPSRYIWLGDPEHTYVGNSNVTWQQVLEYKNGR
jgi:hypothetical protein